MNTDFPEDFFPATHNYYRYINSIELGKKLSKEKSILFCGVVRNAELYIERNILRILRTVSEFKNYHIFIYENDSNDQTREILNKLSNSNSNITVQCEDNVPNDYLHTFSSGEDANHSLRSNMIARCRNKYLDFLSTNNKYDYVCILDLDIRGGWSYDGFYDSIALLESKEDIACVSAYGILSEHNNKFPIEQVEKSKYLMYDSFAFRPYNYNQEPSIMLQASANHFKTSRGDQPLIVNSNFNGIAIYRPRYLLDKKYSIKIYQNNFVDCDHVVIHEQIRNEKGKILLNPNLIVLYSHHRYSQI
jgi:hypothetical protein